MSKKPLILVTNDDGITAKGIKNLVAIAKEFGDVVVVAPDSPQSGMGHAITVNDTLRLRHLDLFDGIESYNCSGTPADCVKLAICEVLERKPDLVLSGINHGSNCSTNVLYSGTMSAAVEASMEGVPAIGFSLLDFDPDADFTASVHYGKKIVAQILQSGLPLGVCLNVNIPKLKLEEIKGVKVCRQAKAHWDDRFDRREDPFGQNYFWLTGSFKNEDMKEDADIINLDNGYVTIVPVQYDMTAYDALEGLNKLNYE